jgi:hypothetical protein
MAIQHNYDKACGDNPRPADLPVTKICEECRNDYEPTGKNQKYCATCSSSKPHRAAVPKTVDEQIDAQIEDLWIQQLIANADKITFRKGVYNVTIEKDTP